ncbi:hypothetical protein FGO68_gene13051 [Halteria grandinella]|uniref:Uncharacterized protein n=1 Tax=Halteria grandinella TaxID=5974 RepID=A0A8J8SVJ3_HALGN|nr:hypothetical protein FGO68_gene13051 [Halteria grandinella]
MCLTDFGTLENRDNQGITLFAIMIFTFSVNFIKVLYCLGKDIITKCKEALIKAREGSDRVISLKGNKVKVYVMEQSKSDSVEVSRIEKVESVISERQNMPKLENKPVRTAHNNRRLLKKPL